MSYTNELIARLERGMEYGYDNPAAATMDIGNAIMRDAAETIRFYRDELADCRAMLRLAEARIKQLEG
jgi:hypothetical protein